MSLLVCKLFEVCLLVASVGIPLGLARVLEWHKHRKTRRRSQ